MIDRYFIKAIYTVILLFINLLLMYITDSFRTKTKKSADYLFIFLLYFVLLQPAIQFDLTRSQQNNFFTVKSSSNHLIIKTDISTFKSEKNIDSEIYFGEPREQLKTKKTSMNLIDYTKRFFIMGLICSTCCVSSANAANWLDGNKQIFQTVADIPKEYIKEKRMINGVIVSITDGDTYRLRNTNKWHKSIEFEGPLSENTIVIRIAAVDTPETPKAGKPGQAFGLEAKEFAKDKLYKKEVSVKILSKDQYGRIVGLVKYKEETKGFLFGLFGHKKVEKDISEEILANGLGVVYRQGGAQYDGSVEKWNKIEEIAIRQRKGLWKDGKDKVELPSDYKKKIKQNKNNNVKKESIKNYL